MNKLKTTIRETANVMLLIAALVLFIESYFLFQIIQKLLISWLKP